MSVDRSAWCCQWISLKYYRRCILLISLAVWGTYREHTEAASWLGKPITITSTRRPVALSEVLFLAGTLSINNIGHKLVHARDMLLQMKSHFQPSDTT